MHTETPQHIPHDISNQIIDAIEDNRLKDIEAIIEQHPDFINMPLATNTHQSPDGSTILHATIKHTIKSMMSSNHENTLQLITYLVEHGAKLTIRDASGCTPFSPLIRLKNQAFLKQLDQHHIAINEQEHAPLPPKEMKTSLLGGGIGFIHSLFMNKR